MTGPRPFSRPNANDPIDGDAAAHPSFAAEEAMKKRDNDPRSKDSYEPANKRGSGIEREFPQDESSALENEDVESGETGNRGAA